MTIGDRIRLARQQLNISQVDLANIAKTTKQNIYKYEKNIITNIPSDKIEAIANALQTTPAFLMGWSPKNRLGEFIKARRGDLTIAELSKMTGIPTEQLISLENGYNFITGAPVSHINLQQAQALAAATNCSFHDYLECMDEVIDFPDSSNFSSNLLPLPETRKIPLLGSIACGAPILAEGNIEDYLEADIGIKADFCLRCQGDSMINARIFDGDIVYIHAQPEVENGEIAAVRIEDEATLKRVRLFDDHVILQAENPTYSPLVFWGEEMNSIEIIGKAVAFTSVVL